MTTFHAVVWMDHQEAHVLMFDREHVESQRVKSRTHHKHQGKPNEVAHLYADIAKALEGTHERPRAHAVPRCHRPFELWNRALRRRPLAPLQEDQDVHAHDLQDVRLEVSQVKNAT
jgi:hypothetical protein